jgi:hypothetical protein
MKNVIKEMFTGSKKSGTWTKLGELQALVPDAEFIRDVFSDDNRTNEQDVILHHLEQFTVHHPLSTTWRQDYEIAHDAEATQKEREAATARLSSTYQVDYTKPLSGRTKWGELSKFIPIAKEAYEEAGVDYDDDKLRAYATELKKEADERKARLLS